MKSKIIASVHRKCGLGHEFLKRTKLVGKKTLLYSLVLIPVLATAQSTNQNFVRTITYKDSTQSSSAASQSISYFDGLGRPVQQIAHKQSGTGNDIVTVIGYDKLGRQPKEYLPVVNGQTLNYHAIDSSAVLNYYNTPAFPGMETTAYPYSEKLFEASPLNRIFKQSAPGNDWKMGGGHEVKFDYRSNTKAGDKVRIFGVNQNQELLNTNSDYEDAALYKTITKDENWTNGTDNTTEEYKDKQGRAILKRTYNGANIQDTYYVYDDYGNLAFVLPPMVDLAQALSGTVLDNLCYQYKYDYRNRLIEKKLPGKRWEYIAYNSQDMPVATGPVLNPWGNGSWGWMITKYDPLGRVAYTGWIQVQDINNCATERLGFESALTTEWAERYEGISSIDGIAVTYTNGTFPTGIKLLTVNYYDNYTYPGAPVLPANVEGQNLITNAKSLSTGSWLRILNDPDDTKADISYTLYDKKSRPVRTHTANYDEGYTTVDSKLDFMGKPLYTYTYHKREAGSSEIIVKDTYEYTPQDRLLLHKQQINGGTEELIAKNEYDDLGQLVTKQVGGQDLVNYIGYQKVDFTYNIRGWLKGINNHPENNDNYNDESDLFLFKINYNTVENDISNQVSELYNGNIAETFWRSKTDNVLRKYGYKYDPLNRLTNSFYQKPGNAVPVSNMYDEHMSYDKNGNIQTMLRNGDFDSDFFAPVQIDNLSYHYDTNNKNLLLKVTDTSNSPKGFKDDVADVGDVNDDYEYDDNGNMVRDYNKDIHAITYNHLNLPVQISFGSGKNITYLYNAAGQKVSKKADNYSGTAITDYLAGGFQYTDGILNFFPHPEGYVNASFIYEAETEGSPYTFNYVYQYKDHLGNIRLSYGFDEKEEVLKVIEENHYYPFGLKHTKYNSGERKYEPDEEYPQLMRISLLEAGEQMMYKYKYNGKEFQDELGLNMYDYGARNYDPALGRWMNIDPLAEQYRRWSPYNYAMNNPVFFIDPDGMSVDPASQQEWDKQKQGIEFQKNVTLVAAALSGAQSIKDSAKSLEGTLSNLTNLEKSTTVYSLNNTAPNSEVKLDTATGNVVIGYNTPALFVHESTHAGQYESGDIAFDSQTGSTYAQDTGDEIAAYKAQYAFDPASVSGIASPTAVTKSADITTSWLQNISDGSGNKPYSQGGSANTGISPLNTNSSKADILKAYPNNAGLQSLPSNFTYKSISTLNYKK